MVVSGSCIGAHNTAIYWALNSLGASTLHIALMATVSALPYTQASRLMQRVLAEPILITKDNVDDPNLWGNPVK